MKNRPNLLLALLLCMCAAQAWGQTYTVSISGALTEITNGAPVANRYVYISSDSAANGYVADTIVLSDANGLYSAQFQVPSSITTGGNLIVKVVNCTFDFSTLVQPYPAGGATITNADISYCGVYGTCVTWFIAEQGPGVNEVTFHDFYTFWGDPAIGLAQTYLWSFGDGGTSTLQNPTHTYAMPGTYPVCLDVVSFSGCTDQYCENVVVPGTPPNCSISLSYEPLGYGPSGFKVASTSSGNLSFWQVDAGNGSFYQCPWGQLEYTYPVNGTYTACVIGWFSDSCSAQACTTFTVTNSSPCLSAYQWYPDTSAQYSVLIVNQAVGNNLNYLWDFGDGNTSTQPYPTHTYAGPSTYQVCLTVNSSNPACTQTFCDSIQVFSRMSTPFTIHVIAPPPVSAPAPAPELALALRPNPADAEALLGMYLPQAGPASIRLLSTTGQVLLTREFGHLDAGPHTLPLPTRALSAGLYTVELLASGSRRMSRLLVAH